MQDPAGHGLDVHLDLDTAQSNLDVRLDAAFDLDVRLDAGLEDLDVRLTDLDPALINLITFKNTVNGEEQKRYISGEGAEEVGRQDRRHHCQYGEADRGRPAHA